MEQAVALPLAQVTLGPGSFFGEMALLLEMGRTATIKTKSAVSLLVFSAVDFRHCLQQHPDIAHAIEKAAAEQACLSPPSHAV